MTDPSPTTALAVREDRESLDLLVEIDVDRLQRQMEVFHKFVGNILKQDTHYGKVPGVDKRFLWQPGAEEIFRAFNCRPAYSTVQQIIDPVTKYALFWRKCEAIYIPTGEVVGEADAICTSSEYENQRGYEFGKKLPVMLAMADKRAFVKAARTLGCASEFFTQDEDLVADASGATPASAPKQRRQSGGSSSGGGQSGGDGHPVGYAAIDGEDQKGQPQWRVQCPEHGWYYAREWGGRDGRPVTIKCNKKTGDSSYCNYQVPKPQPGVVPAEAPAAPTAYPWESELRNGLAEQGLIVDDLREALGVPPEGPVTKAAIDRWFKSNPSASVEALLTLARELMPVEGEYEDVDDLPFN